MNRLTNKITPNVSKTHPESSLRRLLISEVSNQDEKYIPKENPATGASYSFTEIYRCSVDIRANSTFSKELGKPANTTE